MATKLCPGRLNIKTCSLASFSLLWLLSTEYDFLLFLLMFVVIVVIVMSLCPSPISSMSNVSTGHWPWPCPRRGPGAAWACGPRPSAETRGPSPDEDVWSRHSPPPTGCWAPAGRCAHNGYAAPVPWNQIKDRHFRDYFSETIHIHIVRCVSMWDLCINVLKHTIKQMFWKRKKQPEYSGS